MEQQAHSPQPKLKSSIFYHPKGSMPKKNLEDAMKFAKFLNQTDVTFFKQEQSSTQDAQSMYNSSKNLASRGIQLSQSHQTEQSNSRGFYSNSYSKKYRSNGNVIDFKRMDKNIAKEFQDYMSGRSNIDQQSKKSRVSRVSRLQQSDAESVQESMTLEYKKEVALPEVKKKRVNRSTFMVKPSEPSSKRSSMSQSRMSMMSQTHSGEQGAFITDVNIKVEDPQQASPVKLPAIKSVFDKKPSIDKTSTIEVDSPPKQPERPKKLTRNIAEFDSQVYDMDRDLRANKRDAMQLQSDLEQIAFNVVTQNRCTTGLIMDSIMDIRKNMHRFIKEQEVQGDFMRSQIHQIGVEQRMLKQVMIQLDARGKALEDEIGHDDDIWYPAGFHHLAEQRLRREEEAKQQRMIEPEKQEEQKQQSTQKVEKDQKDVKKEDAAEQPNASTDDMIRRIQEESEAKIKALKEELKQKKAMEKTKTEPVKSVNVQGNSEVTAAHRFNE